MDAAVDLATRQPRDRGFVDGAVAREGSDQCRPAAGERLSHGESFRSQLTTDR
jgi:hypothetical protein